MKQRNNGLSLQEIILCFDNVNRFGFPTEFEVIDINLNKLLFHCQPSQVSLLFFILIFLPHSIH